MLLHRGQAESWTPRPLKFWSLLGKSDATEGLGTSLNHEARGKSRRIPTGSLYYMTATHLKYLRCSSVETRVNYLLYTYVELTS